MRVALTDIDRTGYPNLALMKLARWHKAQGDQVLPLNSTEAADRRYASTVFSWNRAKAETLKAQGWIVGGSGVDLKLELPPTIEQCKPDYSLYNIDYGWGFLMRGCIWNCAFCIVPRKEGKAREVASIDDLLNQESNRKRPFVVLLDNEFFWNTRWAIDRLEEFTKRQIDFSPSQGLDVRVLTPELCDALAASPFWNVKRTSRQITFAFDSINIERQYRRGVEMLLSRMKAWHLQSFVLVGFDSTIEEDLRRIQIIREYGIDPYVMVYRSNDSGKMAEDQMLRQLARWVNRRLHRVCEFKDYVSKVRFRGTRPRVEVA